jgi:Fur family iron response transcriptional regulator
MTEASRILPPLLPPHPDREPRSCISLREWDGSRPWRRCEELLRRAGLKSTRQRMALGWLLFARGNRHVTAEMLYEEAIEAKVPVSLATVYNTLNQFTEAGLLRQISVENSRAFFDTNPTEHHHFLIQGEDALLDIPPAEVGLDTLPQPPPGFEIARVDVVVRLRRKPGLAT